MNPLPQVTGRSLIKTPLTMGAEVYLTPYEEDKKGCWWGS
ncbi:hypothetical protein L917_18889, partial [Phytophthora nicotianae]